jgi:hypothetical protein
MNTNEFDHVGNRKSYLGEQDPEFNENAHRWDKGGLVTKDNGIADRLLSNNQLYNELKGDWKRTQYNKSKNIKVTTGRQDDKFYVQKEQMNVEYIAEQCAAYRKAAEQGYMDTLAPIMPDGKLGYKWIDLPKVIAEQISREYFGGMPWAAIKRDKTTKAQFYKVVEKEYPAFVCYPHGKLPIPIEVPYPGKVGADKFFAGANFAGKQ